MKKHCFKLQVICMLFKNIKPCLVSLFLTHTWSQLKTELFQKRHVALTLLMLAHMLLSKNEERLLVEVLRKLQPSKADIR